MSGVLPVLLEALACIGYGAVTLRLLGIFDELSFGERLAFAFAVGFAVLGWLLFPLGVIGWLNIKVIGGVLATGAAGVALVGRPTWSRPDAIGWTGWSLVLVLAGVAGLHLAQALAPPTDADTLAYHFALPKLFLAKGALEFVPRVADGAVPLLVQMTNIPALALGGENGLTLWAMLGAWATTGLLYVLCRRAVGVTASLAAAAVFLTIPAVVYGSGSGQVEVRLCLFVMLTGWGVGRALETGQYRYALLAGLGAGAYIGAKYIGLLFAAAAGAVLLLQRRGVAHGVVFGVAALAVGWQWYWWNWLHTGDPVFPMLFPLLGPDGYLYWDKAHDDVLRESFFGSDLVVPRNPFWLLAYPFHVTLFPSPRYESGRTGLGVMLLLLLPFAVAGGWKFRDRVGRNWLSAMLAVGVLFYGIWFLSGVSQKVRHILPALPLLLIPLWVSAVRWAEAAEARKPLAVAVVLVLGLQGVGFGVFSLPYLTQLARGESRDAFLTRMVGSYPAVRWVNEHLSRTDRVLASHRDSLYLFDVPYVMGTARFQAVIDLLGAETDPGRFVRQTREQGITHMIIARAGSASIEGRESAYVTRLLEDGCLVPEIKLDATFVGSRTFSSTTTVPYRYEVLRFDRPRCALMFPEAQ